MNGSGALRTAPSVLASCLAVACASPADDRVASLGQRIVFGEPSPPGGIEDAVLLLRTTLDGAEVLCSASLVASNLAVTARHCVSHIVQGPFNCTARGELVDNPTGAGRIGLDLPADSIEFYGGATPRGEPLARGRSLVSTLSDTVCVNDIAFVVLDRDVELAPLALRLQGTTFVGEKTVLVGYGMTERQFDSIDFRVQPRLRKAGLTIAAIGPDSIDDGVTTVAPRTLVLEGPSACVADSGGPLLTAAHAIVGVYSLLDGESCTDSSVRNEFVHVPPFRGLVERAFQAAGATPSTEHVPRGDSGPEPSEAGLEPPEESPRSDGGCSLVPRNGVVKTGSSAALGAAAGLWLVLATRAGRRRSRVSVPAF